jgi:hypothetical protein
LKNNVAIILLKAVGTASNCWDCKKRMENFKYNGEYQINQTYIYTPTVSDLEVVLDKV